MKIILTLGSGSCLYNDDEEGVARFSEYGQETVNTPGPGAESPLCPRFSRSGPQQPAAAPPRQLANFAHVCLLMVLVLLIASGRGWSDYVGQLSVIPCSRAINTRMVG